MVKGNIAAYTSCDLVLIYKDLDLQKYELHVFVGKKR